MRTRPDLLKMVRKQGALTGREGVQQEDALETQTSARPASTGQGAQDGEAAAHTSRSYMDAGGDPMTCDLRERPL